MEGYWNGEPAEFIGVIYEVPKPEIATWWFARLEGRRRQGIEVTYGGQIWIIDNEHGDGFYKVTRGLGSPRCSHKSTGDAKRLFKIPDGQINKIVDVEALKKEDAEHDEWLKENYPETYKKSIALRKMIAKNKF